MNGYDLYHFHNGSDMGSWRFFGAHPAREQGRKGTEFTVWAPDVKSVRLSGSFCDWRSDALFMENRGGGVWQLFVPDVSGGELYKYVIETSDGRLLYKADPYAFAAQCPPDTASVVLGKSSYKWKDSAWMNRRNKAEHFRQPMNIYELHAASWRKDAQAQGPADRAYYSYERLGDELIAYVKDMHYTHIELMPVMEHPFDGSWGYQLTGFYAPSARYGTPDDFRRFVDRCHAEDIGVILDWVPGHFCVDAHGLSEFNGKRLYERGHHPNWGTCRFDFRRAEVRSFLLSNAMYWIEEFHIDGLRLDGVSSMIYLNFGVEDAKIKEYNPWGGEEDVDAIEFLRALNKAVGENCPGVFTMAEESSAWPMVTRLPEDGGLGFHYKWNMGWMNDTLEYMETDFPSRPEFHGKLNFSMMYFYSENFVLALSHDEVVHGKRSLIGRMPGDYWRKFAGMRALALYQMTHPGKKLSFMGGEFGQFIEWRYSEGLEWFLPQSYEAHGKLLAFNRSLNALYKKESALWQKDYDMDGFRWLDADNSAQATLLFSRSSKNSELVVLINFVPECYDSYRVGVPSAGVWQEIFSSDEPDFGGSGRTNPGALKAERVPAHGCNYSVVLRTPPVGGLILKKRKV